MPSSTRSTPPSRLGRIILREFFHGAHLTAGPRQRHSYRQPEKVEATERIGLKGEKLPVQLVVAPERA